MLGGGLVPGAVVLLAGEPGVGKSTLLLEVAAQARPPHGARVLYVTGEESAAQVRLRAERIGALDERAATSPPRPTWPRCSATSTRSRPTSSSSTPCRPCPRAEVDGSAGGVTQVREVAAALIRVAKERGIATVLVGHVTKDGSIAGPRVLEHLVDVVLHFEGERHSRLRMVRAVQEPLRPLRRGGLLRPRTTAASTGLPDPSGLFLSRTAPSRCPAPA